MLKFDKRIQEAREYFEMNKAEFAKYIGVAPSTISRYESGAMDVAIGAIEKISIKLNISMAWLLGIEDNMYATKENFKSIPVLGSIKKMPFLDYSNFIGFEIITEKYNADFCIKSKNSTTFFRKTSIVENGNLIAVLDNENIILRRYYKYDRQIVLKDDNTNTELPVKDLKILGKAVLIISEVI